ncbi:uncharacterized protein LOC115629088 [Scaptodrosophila lebanonensis]|uniref:Uncharacterized protein LOC115629002 n=1 Tax=Drosophila lebanonensis TaxID=7225 RepID=A0A6J2U108_DROLE|nr:uncharacterized protein LOC115629002 [Scaptodrosophila lebanonensis]XP_030381261.1 uncharacterized protein LOC115629088 [Scaptodrosophila lebanonensis]
MHVVLFLITFCSIGAISPAYAAPFLPSVDFSEILTTPREKLLLYTHKEFSTLLNDTLLEGALLLQGIIDDARAFYPGMQSPELEAFANFISATKRTNEYDELEELLDQFEEMLDFDSDEVSEPLAELLNQHGFHNFEGYLMERISGALSRIEEHVQLYINSLSKWERQKDSKMVQWLASFRNEHDIDEKMELFLDFVEFFDY